VEGTAELLITAMPWRGDSLVEFERIVIGGADWTFDNWISYGGRRSFAHTCTHTIIIVLGLWGESLFQKFPGEES
jgi:hypothetical protein